MLFNTQRKHKKDTYVTTNLLVCTDEYHQLWHIRSKAVGQGMVAYSFKCHSWNLLWMPQSKTSLRWNWFSITKLLEPIAHNRHLWPCIIFMAMGLDPRRSDWLAKHQLDLDSWVPIVCSFIMHNCLIFSTPIIINELIQNLAIWKLWATKIS